MKTLVDGHVHLYGNQEPQFLLDAAAEAFLRAGRRLGVGSAERAGHLVLVDPAGVDGFGRLLARGARGWTMVPMGHSALTATRDSDGVGLCVVGGRQIRADNGLEVLAHGVRVGFEDGGSLSEGVERVLSAGGVPVIPWGFGKWLGARGSDVDAVLRSSLGGHVLLADSFTRPALAREPAAFKVAGGAGIPIVAGTDPLPFPNQERNAGRYGFLLDLPEDDDPARALIRGLGELEASPVLYGRRQGTLSALRIQVAMQMRAVMGRRSRGDAGEAADATSGATL